MYDSENLRTVDVLHIDTASRRRRHLDEDRWSAPVGQVNLAQFIWRAPEEVYPHLADFGIRARWNEWKLGTDVASLRTGFGNTVFAAYGSDVTMQVFDAGLLGRRVIGFGPPPPATTTTKTPATPAAGEAGTLETMS
jgi:hypothetical protein